jgi:hypothetical protein
MKSNGRLIPYWPLLGLTLLLGWVLMFPTSTQAQVEGNNAVYPASGQCCQGSPAFIDASQFLGHNQGLDLCDTIYGIFVNRWNVAAYPPTGAVIDARGISGATNLTCSHGSPWTEGSNTVSAPSTILLPAGTIVIPTTWVMPNNTRIIGAGDALDNLATGGWPTFTLFVKVGTTRPAATAFLWQVAAIQKEW